MESLNYGLSDKLDLSQGRLEDKLDGIVQDKLDQINLQVATFNKNVEIYSNDELKSLNVSFTVLGQH